MMRYVLLWSATCIPGSLVHTYTLAYLLDIDRKKTFAVVLTALSTTWSTLCRLFPEWPAPQYLNMTVQLVLLFGSGLLFAHGRLLWRLLAPAVITIVVFLPETVAFFLYMRLSRDPTDPADFLSIAADPFALFTMRIVYFVLLCLLCFAVVQVWDRLVRRSDAKRLAPYLLFPLSQAILLALSATFLEAHSQQSPNIGYCLTLVLAAALCGVADWYLSRVLRRHLDQAAAEERAGWLRYLLDEQQVYYEQCLADSEDAARIRHDVRNQLQTAYALIETGDRAAARTLLDGLEARLAQGQGRCQDRVVDAILRVKGSLFDQAGLAYRFACDVPADLPLPKVELCSLFTNVLDNAYHAASGTGGTVDLESRVSHGCLILTCRNPVRDDPDVPQDDGQRHGLGLVILNNIVDRYDGTLDIEKGDSQFQISLLLHLPKA